MLRRKVGIALLLVGGLTPFTGGVAQAGQEDVERLLARMGRAVQDLEYEGVFVYAHNNQLETMHIERRVQGGRKRERLVSLNGSPREVVRDGEKVTCLVPEENAVLVDERKPPRRLPSVLTMRPDRLLGLYDFRLLGQDRVAGRPVLVVAIEPKDAYRYGYRLHLDQETAFPLKVDLLDQSGRMIEQTMFTQLQIDSAPLAQVPVDPATRTEREPPDVDGDAPPAERWAFRNLPDGFALSLHDARPDHPGSPGVEQLVLSDGLSSLSVFVEGGGEEEGLQGGSRMGAVSAWGGRVHGHQVTVVGEVPLATVRAVLEGIYPAVTSEQR